MVVLGVRASVIMKGKVRGRLDDKIYSTCKSDSSSFSKKYGNKHKVGHISSLFIPVSRLP